MGRRDAVQVTLEVVARMRQLEPNLVVTYEPGWERRGNGLAANYEFGTVHHTASATSLTRPFPTQRLLRDGRIDLRGPLCNEAGPACTLEVPRLHVMAAHPANHAGASKASGPVPARSLFNPLTRGLEIDYAGSAPMLAGQLYVGHLWARANADVVGGGDIERIRSHHETSVTGKWDPGYAPGRPIDMNVFRRDAAVLAARISSPAPSGDDDMPQFATLFVPAGEEQTIPIPPSNGGGAGWGRAFASLAVDRFGDPKNGAGPVAVRAAVQDSKGGWRPLIGPTMDVKLNSGRVAVPLRDGDHVLVVSSKDVVGVGVLVEYAAR